MGGLKLTVTKGHAEEVSSYRWVVFGVWSICSVAGFMVISSIGILLPSISSDLDLSPGQQGTLGSAAFWGNIALTIPLSLWASRFRPKPLTTVTLVMGTLFLFLQGWAFAFVVLLLGRLAFGISIVAREPARALLVQQWFLPREAILANAISSAMFGLVVGGGLIVTPVILDTAGDDWKLVLHIFGAFFAGLTVLWLVLGKDKDGAKAGQAAGAWEVGLLREALRHRDLWVSGFGFVGATLAWSAFLSFYPTLMQDTYDLSLRWAGLILALSIMVGGISGLFLSHAIMTGGRRKMILQILGVLMVGTYAGMTLTGSLPVLLPLAFMNGIAWGFYPILYTVPFHLPGIRPREIVVAVAATMTMTSVGTGLGPLISGFLQEAFGDLRPALVVVSFATISLSIAGSILRPGLGDVSPRPTRAVKAGSESAGGGSG